MIFVFFDIPLESSNKICNSYSLANSMYMIKYRKRGVMNYTFVVFTALFHQFLTTVVAPTAFHACNLAWGELAAAVAAVA